MQDALEFAENPAVGIGGPTRKPLRDDTTSVSSVARSSWMASLRHCWRPPGSGSDQTCRCRSLCTPRAAGAWTTLDLPVRDMPVSGTRLTAGSLRVAVGVTDNTPTRHISANSAADVRVVGTARVANNYVAGILEG